MKKLKVIISTILSITLLLSMLTTALPAQTATNTEIPKQATTDKAYELGVNGISAGGVDHIYYANYKENNTTYPILWRVLDTKANNGDSNKLFLMSEYLLNQAAFDGKSETNVWQDAPIRTTLQNLYKSIFTTQEKKNITTTSKGKESINYYCISEYSRYLNGGELYEDTLFLLSAAEAINTTYGFSSTYTEDSNYIYSYPAASTTRVAYPISNKASSDAWWWLRSSYSRNSIDAACVNSDGSVEDNLVDKSSGYIRPAFNFNCSNILFTSPAESTTKSGVSTGSYSRNTEYSGDLKLTVKDSSRTFTADKSALTVEQGKSANISYSNSKTGTNEYISAFILNSSETEILYYERLAKSPSSSGTVSFTVPSSLTGGNYKLYIFNEQCNADNQTDYSSNFSKIALKVITSDKAFKLGTKGISAGGIDHIYYGNYTENDTTYPILWRVLDTKANNGDSNNLFLLSEYLLGQTAFDETEPYTKVWQEAPIRTTLQNMYDDIFSTQEKANVTKTTKADDSAHLFDFYLNQGDLSEDTLFLLSAAEAINTTYGFDDTYETDSRYTYYRPAESTARVAYPISNKTTSASWWWLRSTYSNLPNFVGFANSVGSVGMNYVYDTSGSLRPAFNLNTSDILFTSPAKGTTKSVVNSGGYSQNVEYAGDRKLTVKDSTRTFTADKRLINTSAGQTVNITYNNAVVGDNEYVSAIITDFSEKEILYYAKLKAPSYSGGSASFTVPSDLKAGNYKLYIFNEQCNADDQTDYSSDFSKMTLKVGTTGKAFELSAKGISAGGVDHIYYGNYTENDTTYPILWRVLDTKASSGESNNLFLLSEYLLGQTAFDETEPYTNVYRDAPIRTTLQNMFDSIFTTQEKAHVIKTTKAADSIHLYDNSLNQGDLSEDTLFLLSSAEAINTKYGFDDKYETYSSYTYYRPASSATRSAYPISAKSSSASWWWLRSAYSFYNTDAGYVLGDGTINNYYVYDTSGSLRPAFNLNSSDILFTSPTEGTTKSVVNSKSYSGNATYSGDRKLTVKDSSRKFKAINSAIVAEQGSTVYISYSDATVGDREYVSAIVTNSNETEILYYAKLAKSQASNGIVSFTLPSSLSGGSYKLYIFNEQCNADDQTDYASAFSKIDLTVIPTYTITFNANGGSCNTTHKIVVSYSTYGTLPEPTRSGYTFDGWYTSETDGSQVTSSTTVSITSNQTLYAHWSAKTYKVTFDPTSGSCDTVDKTVTYDSTYGTLPEPTRADYTFAGWYTSKTGGSKVISSTTVSITSNQTLYAHWTSVNYNISYNLNGGTASNPTTYTVEDEITLEAPTKTGYTFIGWTGANGDVPQTSVTIAKNSTGDKKYTANWTATDYNITYTLNGGTATNPATYTVEDQITLANPTKTGYTFIGWIGTNGFDPEKTVTVDKGSVGDRIYIAQWKRTEYKVTINLNGGTASNPGSYNIESSAFTLANPTKTGYTFLGWTGSNGSTPEKSITVEKGSTGDKNYTANWLKDEYTIKYYLNKLDSADLPTSYNVDSSVTIPELSKEGYTFLGWTGAEHSEPVQTITIPAGSTGNRVYTANWEPIVYQVSLNANTGTFGGSPSKTINVTYDSTYGFELLTEPTKTNYAFLGWFTQEEGGDVITPSTLYTTAENSTIYAHWAQTAVKITFANSSLSSNNIAISSTLDLAKYLPKKSGFVFKGWYTDSACQTPADKNAAYDKDTTLYAGWEKIKPVALDPSDFTVKNIVTVSDYTAETLLSGFELYGCQIKMVGDKGLRFVSRISKTLLDSLDNATHGYILAKKETVDSLSVDSLEVSADIKAYDSQSTYLECNDYYVSTAAITGLDSSTYGVEICARPFIKYTDANGIERYYYYTETGASNAKGAYYTSAKKVANYLLDNGLVPPYNFINEIAGR